MLKLSTLDQLNQEIYKSAFYVISESSNELSVICEENFIPNNYFEVSRGWRLIKFRGSINDGLVGVVNLVTKPLADSGISVIVHTTYDAGYFGVSAEQLEGAVKVLEENRFTFQDL